ncbi:MAG: cell division ATP-binding protein FtsE [Salibacteraceae bacterium]|mgnify:CR=1 FL=1
MALDTIIELQDATVSQQHNLVLTRVSLTIEKGEFVYLTGKSGSGKSSLLRTLYGELPLKEGQGNVVGFELHKLKNRQIPFLRRKLGIIFQDFQLLTDRTVNENLNFVMRATGWKDKKEMQTRILNVLEKVGLATKGYKMPHELSGGEQQRVAIARALINDPDLILADEPTGNLDPETSQSIIQLLIDISKSGRAIFMATHDITLMEKFPSRTVTCEYGNMVEPTGQANTSAT